MTLKGRRMAEPLKRKDSYRKEKRKLWNNNLPFDSHSDRSVALKDLDFNEEGVTIELSQEDKEMLKKQIELDAKFCANAKVIDYSLLLGIHYIKPGK